MKKLFCILLAGIAIASCGTPSPEPTQETFNTIAEIESLPDNQCLYSVDVKGEDGYTFIDACGKYSVGEQF